MDASFYCDAFAQWLKQSFAQWSHFSSHIASHNPLISEPTTSAQWLMLYQIQPFMHGKESLP
jgi:hypothetical protein